MCQLILKLNLEGILLLKLYQMVIFSLYLFMTLRGRVVKKDWLLIDFEIE